MDDGDDEELEQPSRPEWTRLRRVRIPLAGLVVAAAVVSMIVHLAHSGSAHDASAPTSSPPPSVTLQPKPATAAIGATQCPPGVSCFSTSALPSGVRDAVRAAVPGVTVRSSFSLLGNTDGAGSHLLFRRVDLRTAAATIMIVVQRSDVATAPASITASGRDRSQTTFVATDRFPALTVTVTATSAHDFAVAGLRLLATDERLRVASV